jgi:hypothetical protein
MQKPSTSAIVTLECVGNTVGGESISTAEWQGLSLRALPNEARVSHRPTMWSFAQPTDIPMAFLLTVRWPGMCCLRTT